MTSHQKFLLSVDGECTTLENLIDLANDNMPILTEYQDRQIQDMVDSIELDLQREVKFGNKDAIENFEEDDQLFSDYDFDFKFRMKPKNKKSKKGKQENPLQSKMKIQKDFEFDINLDNLMTIKEEHKQPRP